MGRGSTVIGGVVVIVVIALVMLLAPSALNSADDARTDNQTDAFLVTTNASSTNATVTLSQSLWKNKTKHATVTSDYSGDNPIADTYTSSNRALLVTGLAANQTRNLTVTYRIAALEDYTGADQFIGILPTMLFAAAALMLVGVIWRVFKG